MQDTRQFGIMVTISVVFHLLVMIGAVLWTTLRSSALEVSPTHEAQIVQLIDIADMPENPTTRTQPPIAETPPDNVVAFRNISAVVHPPTPTPEPTPIPTPTPRPRPTPTPRPRPTATPQRIPTPEAMPTRSPTPTTPQVDDVVAFEVPRRQPAMQADTPQKDLQSVVQQEQQRQVTPTVGRSPGQTSSFSHQTTSNGTPMMFETESAFPYPEYLEHLKEKIEGLWFPQGAGTVSIYLIIERNGKILKSGVDKGSGVGVDKLRESVIRVFENVKRFRPLPEEYEGTVLQVRITVRR